MNILAVEDISKSYGLRNILSHLSFGIAAGEKVGLIGVNGTGKSTLLKVLAGKEEPDSGRVVRMGGLRIGYLMQNPAFSGEQTVLEAALAGDLPVMKLVREYEQVLEDLKNDPEEAELQKQLLTLTEKIDATQAWQVENEAKTILTQLGIYDFSQRVNQLSGGTVKRLALATALIHPVDLLILDEPTNHIDNQTVDWLEQYLSQREGALLLVTHDRYFLDRVVNRIIELDQGNLYSYMGNYSSFLEKKAEREETKQAVLAKRKNLFRQELAWMRRGAKARSTKQQARIARFEQLQQEIASADVSTPKLEITAASTRLGKKVISLDHLTKGFGDKKVINDFSYGFEANDRVGIIGPNGIGKSTLLHLLNADLLPDQGEVIFGSTVRIGYFAQEATELDETKRVIDYIQDIAAHVPDGQGGTVSASQMLERFLFPSAQQWTPIADLSGGEKRRLYLLGILISAPNVLLLDEPTNDLDIPTLCVLEDYLDDFAGVVIAVSHDRYFLDRMAHKILVMEKEGKIRHFVGNYSDYQELQRKEETEAEMMVAEKPHHPTPARPLSMEEPKERPLKLSYKEQREWEGIEARIAEVESQLAAVKEQMRQSESDYLQLLELTKTQQNLEAALEQLMERWVYLNERMDAINFKRSR